MVYPLVSRWVILKYFMCHVSLDMCVENVMVMYVGS